MTCFLIVRLIFILQVSILQLHMLLSEHDSIPWEALSYLIGGVSYGGRVTDEWDRRCLHALLGRFFCPEALEKDYSFSPDKVCKIQSLELPAWKVLLP